MSAMEYESEPRGYEDEGRDYDRERSRSPRGNRDDADIRDRNEPSNGRDDAPTRTSDGPQNDDDEDDPGAVNPGSNLFVTGIHPRLTEEAVTRLFEKYGEVEKCQIMRDPHSGDSRGFGFVKMVTPDQADAAKDGLQGMVHEGRTLSIEKARRAKPRTPTPGKYYGPPKRDDFRRPGRGGRERGGGGRFGGRDSYDDRRRGYGGRGGDDYYGGGGGGGGGGGSSSGGYRSRYDDRYDDRSHGGGRRERDDYGGRQVDRYASGGGRDDRAYGRGGESRGGESRGGDDRRGGGGGYYDRPARDYSGAPAEDRGAYAGGDRAYDDRAPR